MEWNEQKVLLNIRQSKTDDLLDRITAYRKGMEESAIAMIEKELQARGITTAEIAARREEYERECLFLSDGTALICSLCRKPAATQVWSWHKWWGKLPLFPRRIRYCKQHRDELHGT